MSAAERATAAHRSRWGDPDFVARAPGRVNLIGEHTDYNEGFTLPMALPFDTAVAFSSDGDQRAGPATIASAGFGEIVIDPNGDPASVASWARHLAGVISLLAEHGVPTGGWRAAVDTDIPTGASLSSSAAIEVAAITALLHRAGVTWEPIDVARLGQRVENEVVGLPSGIMDQFISAGAVEGHASLMDCRHLTLTPAHMPADAVVAVMDTGTRRVLADAAYGDRRAACERVVAELGIASLRDATPATIAAVMDPVDRRRAHHVVTENQRTVDAAAAMGAGDVVELGRLMTESHESLRHDYEVSGPGLDAIVQVAHGAPGCLGARMTGGGFAGCAVALVRADDADRFGRDVVDRYDHDGLRARIWICSPAAGASVLGTA
ncbi:MAG: galactokinase [Ilumatobacter sp.]|uniref:galactokinase n=1 Tax=Ilumatobacter sp. TaxID=1967498 RepID=UPI002623F926|nr:galactokinase [Ilumatobacter sp.]MDJ0769874.1 galactokinase [Ilumatobacter sp.]